MTSWAPPQDQFDVVPRPVPAETYLVDQAPHQEQPPAALVRLTTELVLGIGAGPQRVSRKPGPLVGHAEHECVGAGPERDLDRHVDGTAVGMLARVLHRLRGGGLQLLAPERVVPYQRLVGQGCA